MADLTNMRMDVADGALREEKTEDLPALAAAGFTPDEAARLIAARERAHQGTLNEWTEDYKRLRFARWLYEQGRLES